MNPGYYAAAGVLTGVLVSFLFFVRAVLRGMPPIQQKEDEP